MKKAVQKRQAERQDEQTHITKHERGQAGVYLFSLFLFLTSYTKGGKKEKED